MDRIRGQRRVEKGADDWWTGGRLGDARWHGPEAPPGEPDDAIIFATTVIPGPVFSASRRPVDRRGYSHGPNAARTKPTTSGRSSCRTAAAYSSRSAARGPTRYRASGRVDGDRNPQGPPPRRQSCRRTCSQKPRRISSTRRRALCAVPFDWPDWKRAGRRSRSFASRDHSCCWSEAVVAGDGTWPTFPGMPRDWTSHRLGGPSGSRDADSLRRRAAIFIRACHPKARGSRSWPSIRNWDVWVWILGGAVLLPARRSMPESTTRPCGRRTASG